MNTRGLTENEIKQILEQVKNKLVSNPMQVKNVQGRTISTFSKSGAVEILKKEEFKEEFTLPHFSDIFKTNCFYNSYIIL